MIITVYAIQKLLMIDVLQGLLAPAGCSVWSDITWTRERRWASP